MTERQLILIEERRVVGGDHKVARFGQQMSQVDLELPSHGHVNTTLATLPSLGTFIVAVHLQGLVLAPAGQPPIVQTGWQHFDFVAQLMPGGDWDEVPEQHLWFGILYRSTAALPPARRSSISPG